MYDYYVYNNNGNLSERDKKTKHDEMKSKSYLQLPLYESIYKKYNKLWMLPHRMESDIYFTIFPKLSEEEREKIQNEWKNKTDQRFSEPYESKDGYFSLEIGNLFANSYLSFGGKTDFSEKFNNILRLLIVWKEGTDGQLDGVPKLYLTTHYKNPIDVDKLNLD